MRINLFSYSLYPVFTILFFSAIGLLLNFFTLAVLNRPSLGFKFEKEGGEKGGGKVVIGERYEANLPKAFYKGREIIRIDNGILALDIQAGMLAQASSEIAKYYESLSDYFSDRSRFYRILSSEKVNVFFGDGSAISVEPYPTNSWRTLNFSYFFLLFLVALLSSLLVGILFENRSSVIVWYLFFSGIGVILTVLKGAMAELSPMTIEPVLEYVLEFLNGLGHVSFLAFGAAILWHYPSKLHKKFPGDVLILLLYATLFLYEANAYSIETSGLYLVKKPFLFQLIFFTFILSLGLVLTHLFSERAKVTGYRFNTLWVCLSWFVGSSYSVLLYSLPNYLGLDPLISKGYSRLGPIIVFLMIAYGMYRFNFFDMPGRTRVSLNWIKTILIFIFIDVLVLLAILFNKYMNSTLYVILYFFVYFPLRTFYLYSLVKTGGGLSVKKSMIDITNQLRKSEWLNPSSQGKLPRKELWENMLQMSFSPMSAKMLDDFDEEDRIRDNGLRLCISGFLDLPAYELAHVENGHRLFTANDLSYLNALKYLFSQLFKYQEAFNQGVLEEKQRISSSLHDQLVPKLAQLRNDMPDEEKEDLVSESIKEVRLIIQDLSRGKYSLEEVNQQLEVSVNELCEKNPIVHIYEANLQSSLKGSLYNRQFYHLRGCVMEAVNNSMKHSQAKTIRTKSETVNGNFCYTISDDGKGFDPKTVKRGKGLDNILSRMRKAEGKANWETTSQGGTLLKLELPFFTD